jgi:hypothetical protein
MPPIQSASAPAAIVTTQTSASNAVTEIPTKKIAISAKSAPSARRCDGARIGAECSSGSFSSRAMQSFVSALAQGVRTLAVFASAAALVIAVSIYDDGVAGDDVLVVLLAIAPPVMLWVLWTALRELAGLPERLRRLPETARGHGEDMRRLAGDLRTPGRRLLSVPLALWRLREVTELVRPHAAVLPFLSVWFLTLSAIAAFAAVAEVVIALVLLIAAVV